MIELSFSMAGADLQPFLTALEGVDASAKPSRASNDENGPQFSVADIKLDLRESQFSRFKAGFFLFSESVLYEVAISPKRSASVRAWSSDYTYLEQVSAAFSVLLYEFGYVCEAEERIHRNRIAAPKSYGVHEAWVGRDYRRYLPGVYWLTFVGRNLIAQYTSTLSATREVALDIQELSGGCRVQLYANPAEWSGRAELIDTWCLETPGCFSKRYAEQDLEAAETFSEAAAAVAAWP